MSKKPQVFLESHHINNMFTGFGHFNYWMLKSLSEAQSEFEFTAYALRRSPFKDFADKVKFKRYYSLHRHKPLRIRTRYDIWHSLNQNTKVEPYHDPPYLMTLHDVNFMEQDPVGGAKRKNFKLLKEKINRSDTIVYISEFAKRSANKYFDIPSSIPQQVIYNGNPVSAIAPVHSTKPPALNKPFLLSLGQFRDTKNFHSLVGMLSNLKDYQLVLAGDNETLYGNAVKEEIRKHGMEKRVILTGRITELEKHFYLQNCEAFLFPSLCEGFGMPPIEAMAYGKPVFLANRTSLPEIGGDFAFYWDTNDPTSMAEVFREGMNIYQNNNTLYSLELKKRAEFFDWKKTASEYLQVYRSLL